MNRKDILKSSPANSAIILLVVTLILTSGISCKPPADPMLDMLDTQLSNLKVDSLSRTMQFVESPIRFSKQEFEEKLAASLNRWAKSEAPLMEADAWNKDALADDLLANYGQLQPVQKVAELNFINSDSYQLQQRFWLDRLAKRLIANPDNAPFELYRLASGLDDETVAADSDDQDLAKANDGLTKILLKTMEGLTPDQAGKLSEVMKSFDWVVRNIHLLDGEEYLKDLDADSLRLNDSEDLAQAGVPGLGYTRFAWNTLLTSRGDYVDRAKVFMIMAEQRGINSVMLMPEGSEPWAVGVQIGEQLFLFDTKLGLPVPGEKPGTIATLAEVMDKPQILSALDLNVDESLKDDTKYWVTAEQLKNLQGLLLVSPESLSYRYWELENKLVGDSKMKLTTQPTKVLGQLPKIDGVTYGLWDIEFKTHQFRLAVRDAIAKASFDDRIRDKIRWYFLDELYINEFVNYRTARSKYFVGIFETVRNDGNLNAIELFYQMIYKDSKIASLATDQMFQVRMALNPGETSSAEFQATIKGVQANMRLVRRDSGFFLSQCHFDNGNYGTAANWLTTLEEIDDALRWKPSINYLRARSFEAQRDYKSALDAYDDQESEQFHGNLIRARLLKELSQVAANP